MRTLLRRALCLVGGLVVSVAAPATAAGTWIVTLTAPPTVAAPCPVTIPISGTIVDQSPYVSSVTYNVNNFPDPAAGGPVQQGPQLVAAFAPDHTFAFSTTRMVAVSGHYKTQVQAFANAGTVDSPTVLTTVTCTNATRPAAWPDFQPYGHVKVGNQSSGWGGSITLTDADRIPGTLCGFDITFWVANKGAASMVASIPTVLAVDGVPVTAPSAQPFTAYSPPVIIRTTANLPDGTHVLTLDINKPPVVTVSTPSDGHAQLNYTSTGQHCRQR